jgi:hypothetical protein
MRRKMAEDKRPIAIWGTGVEAAAIYYQFYKDGKQTALFFDNYVETEGKFLDMQIVKPTFERVGMRYYTFVPCKYATYFNIVEQLIKYGLKEVCDFVYYACYNKKIAILHGNCHMEILR